MSTVTEATSTEQADRFVQMGLAEEGDLILSSAGKLYRVDRLMKGGVNYAATAEDGRGWKIRVAYAKAAPVGAVFSGPAAADPSESEAITLGTVIELTGKFAGSRYVVIRDSGGTCSAAKLGGDKGRYVRGIAKSRVTVVDPADL